MCVHVYITVCYVYPCLSLISDFGKVGDLYSTYLYVTRDICTCCKIINFCMFTRIKMGEDDSCMQDDDGK